MSEAASQPVISTESRDGPSPDYQQTLRIPITVTIGVTGHRKLSDESILRASVRKVLAELDRILAHTPHAYVVVSPLAEGADRLVATEVLAWPVADGIDKPSLEVLLPMPVEEYVHTFEKPTDTENPEAEFRELLRRARSEPRVVGKAESRKLAYEQVGHEVVHSCNVLIVLWDGKQARGKGGTQEIVEYARRTVGRSLFWINAENGHISEERRTDGTLETLEHLDAYNAEPLSNEEIEADVRRRYDKLTREASQSGLAPETLQPLQETLLPHLVRATLLAGRCQNYYRRAGTVMYLLAAAAVAPVAILTILHYDESRWIWSEVVIIVAVLLTLAASAGGHWRRLLYNRWKPVSTHPTFLLGDWHRKWIDYRFLAERLRAAIFLFVAGIACEPPRPPEGLSLSHRPDEWMVTAFAWISKLASEPSRSAKSLESLKKFLLQAWIEDQLAYYQKASRRHEGNYKRLEIMGSLLFGITLLAAFCHAMKFWHESVPSVTKLLAGMAIILPAFGAAVAAIRTHGEYRRNSKRYDHMARYLDGVTKKIAAAADMKELRTLLEQANEVMMREHQDWRVVILFQELKEAI